MKKTTCLPTISIPPRLAIRSSSRSSLHGRRDPRVLQGPRVNSRETVPDKVTSVRRATKAAPRIARVDQVVTADKLRARVHRS
jgi:hypothetical protein